MGGLLQSVFCCGHPNPVAPIAIIVIPPPPVIAVVVIPVAIIPIGIPVPVPTVDPLPGVAGVFFHLKGLELVLTDGYVSEYPSVLSFTTWSNFGRISLSNLWMFGA